MRPSVSRGVALGFLVVIAILVGSAVITFRNAGLLLRTGESVSHTLVSLDLLKGLQAELLDAETGQRGYMLTGEERYLEPYHRALGQLASSFLRLRKEMANDPEQLERLGRLEGLVREKIQELEATVALRKEQGFEAAVQVVRTDQGKRLMDEIRTELEERVRHEEALLMDYAERLERGAYLTLASFSAASLLSVVLLVLTYLLVAREIKIRKENEAALQRLNREMAQNIAELQARTGEMLSLSEMGSYLQACLSAEDAAAAASRFAEKLFPVGGGVLYLMHPSRNYLEAIAHWGGVECREPTLPPEACWGLRRGQLHFTDGAEPGLACPHLESEPERPFLSVCAPMLAHGDLLGLLHLRYRRSEAQKGGDVFSSHQRMLVNTVAEQVGLAIANLRLRDSLQQQSIRDPLTGLYNRRFLEEVLERELARARRRQAPLALVIADVDRFKGFNDSFGHEAGDMVLQSLARLLKSGLRDSDIVCRYGGEEFVLILPEATASGARERAEALRCAVHGLQLHYREQALGPVTISLGVAAFPEHGDSSRALLAAADAALYEAKRSGRDRVAVANTAGPSQ
jgi:diguanylate cyclase (GGDEF)-like protein